MLMGLFYFGFFLIWDFFFSYLICYMGGQGDLKKKTTFIWLNNSK